MSGAKFKPVKGLDQLIAKMIVDNVQDVVVATERQAKELAPPTKTWTSLGDSFVRKTHRAAHGDEVPENLRFTLDAYSWDIKHPGAVPVQKANKGGHSLKDSATAPGFSSYMLEPRDHTQGHYVQSIHCRCFLVLDPEGVARMVSSQRAKAVGTKVSGLVYAEGKHVIGAEYGEVYPDPNLPPAEGTYFMHRTVAAMGARAMGPG